MADNLDWLYDYLLQFLKSPGWRVPILNFIDQYCYQFEDSAENKLVYTEIHAKFKELIDGLLESLCITIGITQEQFLKVCEKGIQNPSHKRVFEQMLACDNFISFKKLMLKRNKELELEAAKNIEKNVTPKVNEDVELELARTLSLKDAEERKRLEDKYNDELRQAMKLSEEEFQAHLSAMKQIEEADQRKENIFKIAEEREQARLQALKEEADKVLKQKLEEEQKLEELRKEEMRIKKMIEDKKLEEMRKSEVDSVELREKELQMQIKLAEVERLAKEAEAQKLQNQQFELLRKVQEAEERRRAEAAELEQKRRRKEEKLKEKELIRQQEELKRKEEIDKQRLTIMEEEKRIELEKQRLREEAKRVEEERQRLEIEKQEKLKRKLEKQRLLEEKRRKDEEEKLKSLELEERKKIEEETERIQRLQKENKKLEEIMSIKKKEKAKKARAKKMKQEEEVKVQLGPESSLGFKNFDELTFDEAVESEIKRVQDSVIKQQEIEVSGKVKSSLPPIHGKMGLMSGVSLNVESVGSSPEKKGPETLAEREARLKAQRDALVEAKKKKRDEAHSEYLLEGGVDLGKKAMPAVSNEELEKRKQILMKIKTYSEENDN